MLAVASRREFASLSAAPAPTLDNGVITGCIVSSCSTSADGVTYTVLSGPANGGKVYIDATTGKYSFLPFAPESGIPSGTDTFTVLVSKPSALATQLTSIPIIGAVIFQPLITQLQQVPILNNILAPVIGQSITQTINIDVTSFTGGAPIAFTTMVTSQVQGTQISVNYFPKIGLAVGGQAPTILNGPGLGSAGNIDPNSVWGIEGVTPGLAPMRVKYNVVTWDPRGEFASGGVLQLDSPDYEGKDVVSIIDWVAHQPTTLNEGDSLDPYLGMVGGSYGGGIQLVTAPLDSRIDAIAPAIAWHTLPDSLYPNEAFKTSMSTLLLLDLVTAGARINPEIYAGILTGATLGVLTPSQIALLARSTPDVKNIDIPTLYIQGTVDVLFPLDQAMDNAALQQMMNPDVPVKMLWFCGGHGICLDLDPINQAQQDAIVLNSTMAWMDAYVLKKEDYLNGVEDTLPDFQWVDQNGQFYTADVLPSQLSFYGPQPYRNPTYTSGEVLPIMPRGGSGPQTLVPLPYSIAFGAEATNAVNVPVKNPAQATYIVGAPTVTIHYKGIGTSSHIYVQLVDTTTHKVVGNIVSPIDVTLDGTDQSISMQMEAIAYTLDPNSTLELQVVTSATAYEDFVQAGVIQIQSVDLALPTINSAVHVTPVNAVPNSVLASL
jgi:ABC-2 type transport system ATP-binding protein